MGIMNAKLSRIKHQIIMVGRHLYNHFIWFFNSPKVMLKSLGILVMMWISFEYLSKAWFFALSGTVFGLAFAQPGMVMLLATDYLFILEMIVLYGLIHFFIRRYCRILVIRWIIELVVLIFLMYTLFLYSIDVVLMRWISPFDRIKEVFVFISLEFNQLMKFNFNDGIIVPFDIGLILFENRLLIAMLIPTGVFINSIRHRNTAQQRIKRFDTITKEYQVARAQRALWRFGGSKPTFTWREWKYRIMAGLGYGMYIFVVLFIGVMLVDLTLITDDWMADIVGKLLLGLLACGFFLLARWLIRRSITQISNYDVMTLLLTNVLVNFIVIFFGLHFALASFFAYRLFDTKESLTLCFVFLGVIHFALINGVRLLIKFKVKQIGFMIESGDALELSGVSSDVKQDAWT